ncbi:MAG: RtcB family protein [Verrucomicrobiia bacterium]
MELKRLEKKSDFEWVLEPQGAMRAPAILFASEKLLEEMDDKVLEQAANVASLPGIQSAAFAMPDAHWGYGFPIGGVAAFDPDEGGVVSAGGVGFDISCGVRTILTGIPVDEVLKVKEKLADTLFRRIPAGVGSTGKLRLSTSEMDEMLERGALWAVERGYGDKQDLERIEEGGCVNGAMPEAVSYQAKKRQEDEVGTLGSGNHYLEVQEVIDIYDDEVAKVFGLKRGDVVVSIHCGSRGLGHQINTEFLKQMVVEAQRCGIKLPDRELACAPINSPTGRRYIGAMRAAINCALANREVLTHLTRQAFREVFGDGVKLTLLYDVSHNTCKEEVHIVNGVKKRLFVHRKGATRAYGPDNPELPAAFRDVGQPVLIGGSMGTCSYILVGTKQSEEKSFGSSVHGAGRSISRAQATRNWEGRQVVNELAKKGILIRSPSMRGVAEEAPGAYKDVSAVVESAVSAGLSRKVARLKPLICIKG